MHTSSKARKILSPSMVSLMMITLACSMSLIGCGDGKKAEVEVPKIKVVELLSDKEAGDKITTEDLGDEEISDDPANKQFINEYIKDPSEAEGKVARYKLSKGQQMMKDDLVAVTEGSIAVTVAGKGMSKLLKLKDESKPSLEKVASSFLEEEIEKAEIKESPDDKNEDSKKDSPEKEGKSKESKGKGAIKKAK